MIDRSNLQPLVNIPRKKRTRKPLRRVSPKRTRINERYLELRSRFLQLHPYCQIWLSENGYKESDVQDGMVVGGSSCTKFFIEVPESEEIHHIKFRGKYFLDTSTWLAVCPGLHRKIHANPAWAYEKGYLKKRKQHD